MTPTTAAIFGDFSPRLPNVLNDGSAMAQHRNEAEVSIMEGDTSGARSQYRVVLNLLNEAQPITRALTAGVSAVYSAALSDIQPQFAARFERSLKELSPRHAGIVLDLVQQAADFFPGEPALAGLRDLLAQKQAEVAEAQEKQSHQAPQPERHPFRDAFSKILRFQF